MTPSTPIPATGKVLSAEQVERLIGRPETGTWETGPWSVSEFTIKLLVASHRAQAKEIEALRAENADLRDIAPNPLGMVGGPTTATEVSEDQQQLLRAMRDWPSQPGGTWGDTRRGAQDILSTAAREIERLSAAESRVQVLEKAIKTARDDIHGFWCDARDETAPHCEPCMALSQALTRTEGDKP